VNAEVEDMYKEFQREKEDLLESIRMLQDQMQLKVREGGREGGGSVGREGGMDSSRGAALLVDPAVIPGLMPQ
jgi:hypothetical protein